MMPALLLLMVLKVRKNLYVPNPNLSTIALTTFSTDIMFQHKLPNGNIIATQNLPRELAIKRMIDEERWMQEHREELEVSSQQLFDDMFGG